MSLWSPEQAAGAVQAVFERILREQMAGLPLLNRELEVATVGFRMHEGRIAGVVVTPWMMSLLLFPGEGDQWETLALGAKESFDFPGGRYRFMANTIEGLGRLMMYSVYSPMHEFANQASACAEAERFLTRVMTPTTDGAADPIDEELLGRILRGEKVAEVKANIAESSSAEAPSPAPASAVT